MENVYLLELIACMEREIQEHQNGKYSNCDKHSGCNERIEKTIVALKEQVDKNKACCHTDKLQKKQSTTEDQQAVRGEELEGAELLERLAQELDKLGIKDEAEQARSHARELLASQLNEFDGFNYDSEEKKKGPAVVDKPKPVEPTVAS